MKKSREAESISGSLKEPCKAGGPMIYHRDLWEALGGKDKLAYPCSLVLPTDSLSYPYPLRSPRSLWLINNREICVSRRAGPVSKKTKSQPVSVGPRLSAWVCG
jgi:hypothetical protein